MPNIGSLLKKKRTRDKDGNEPQTPTSPSTNDIPPTPTSSSNLSKTTSQGTKEPIDENNLEQAPTQAQPVDPNKVQQDALESEGIPVNNTSSMGGTDGATATPMQPPMAQGKPPQNGQQSGIQRMADGTWPVQRDAKATKGKYSLTDFEFRRTLGTGSFGRVHLVKSKHNFRFYAIKVLKKAQVVKMKQVEHTNDERKMLARVKHPFLITLWGTFNDSKNLYMVMDFVEGGELFSLLRKSQVCHMGLFRFGHITLTASIEISQSSRQILCCRSSFSA